MTESQQPAEVQILFRPTTKTEAHRGHDSRTLRSARAKCRSASSSRRRQPRRHQADPSRLSGEIPMHLILSDDRKGYSRAVRDGGAGPSRPPSSSASTPTASAIQRLRPVLDGPQRRRRARRLAAVIAPTPSCGGPSRHSSICSIRPCSASPSTTQLPLHPGPQAGRPAAGPEFGACSRDSGGSSSRRRTCRRGYVIKELPVHHRTRPQRQDPGLQIPQDARHLRPARLGAGDDLAGNEAVIGAS